MNDIPRMNGKGRIKLDKDDGFLNTRKLYDDLLIDVKIDGKLINDIIPYRKNILKHRITCEAILIGKQGTITTLNIYSLLIEDGVQIRNFWVGKEIDPSSWNTLLEMFKTLMREKCQVNNVVCKFTPIKKDVVVGVSMVFDYA